MTAVTRPGARGADAITTNLVSHGLALVGVLLAVTAIGAGTLRLDDLGLHASVAPTYYLGLVLLPAASMLQLVQGRRASAWAIVLHVVLFIAIVWLTPVLLEGTPRFRTSYANYGDVDPLVRGLGLQPETFIYHNWPLFPVLVAGLVSLGVPVVPMLALFPLIAMLSYLPPLAVLLTFAERAARRQGSLGVDAADRDQVGVSLDAESEPAGAGARIRAAVSRLRPTPTVAMALWILPVFDWTGQDYFSPQAFAYLLYLVLLAVLADVALNHEGRLSPGRLGLILAVFTAIVATHVLTSLFALSLILFLSLARLVRRPTLVFTTLAIFAVWQVYVAAPFLDFYRDPLLASFLSLGDFLQRNLTERVEGSEGHAGIAQLRIVVTLLAASLGVIGLLILGRRGSILAPVPRFVFAGLASIALVAPVTIYGGEMLIRALLFGIPFLAIVVVAALNARRYAPLLAGALVVGAVAHMFTHYGNELYDYVAPDELAGFEFAATLGPANIYGGAPAAQFLNTTELDFRNSSLPRGGVLDGLPGYLGPLDHAWANPDLPVYVAVSRGDDSALRLFHDAPGFMAEVRSALDQNPEFEPVFDRPDFVLYRWTDQTTVDQ